jgi:hypothetical protein
MPRSNSVDNVQETYTLGPMNTEADDTQKARALGILEEMRNILGGCTPHIPVKTGRVIARFSTADACLDFCDHNDCYPEVLHGPLPFAAMGAK